MCAQGSRDPPPPLPGGYRVGEMVYYTGVNQAVSTGDKLEHGGRGVVTGPATCESHKGKGVDVKFPGNKDNFSCLLTEVRRLPALLPPGPTLRAAAGGAWRGGRRRGDKRRGGAAAAEPAPTPGPAAGCAQVSRESPVSRYAPLP